MFHISLEGFFHFLVFFSVMTDIFVLIPLVGLAILKDGLPANVLWGVTTGVVLPLLTRQWSLSLFMMILCSQHLLLLFHPQHLVHFPVSAILQRRWLQQLFRLPLIVVCLLSLSLLRPYFLTLSLAIYVHSGYIVSTMFPAWLGASWPLVCVKCFQLLIDKVCGVLHDF